jgi:hypothetical protein
VKVRTVCITVLLLLMGCCLLVAGCESMDKSEADMSPSTQATLLAQLDKGLLGTWEPLETADNGVLRFDPDGRMYYLSEDPNEDSYEFAHRVEGDLLVLSDDEGVNQVSVPYAVEGDVLTITEPDSGTIETYQRWDSSVQAAQVDSELLGDWYLLDPPESSSFTFNADGTVEQDFYSYDPAAVEDAYFYTYRVDGDRLIFTNEQGVDEAGGTYSVEGDVLTITNTYSGIAYTYELLGTVSD